MAANPRRGQRNAKQHGPDIEIGHDEMIPSEAAACEDQTA